MDSGCCFLIRRSDKGDDKVQLSQKTSMDDDDNGDDDGGDGAELLDAALKDKRGKVIRSILNNNPWLIHIADPMGDTFHHVAARAGNKWAVRELISFMEERPLLKKLRLKKVFTDVNANGDTALHLALRNGHQTVAYYLIKEETGAATIVNNDGVTAFQIAKLSWYYRICASLAYQSCDELELSCCCIDELNDGLPQ